MTDQSQPPAQPVQPKPPARPLKPVQLALVVLVLAVAFAAGIATTLFMVRPKTNAPAHGAAAAESTGNAEQRR